MKTTRRVWLLGVLVLASTAVGQRTYERAFKMGVDRFDRSELVMAVKTTRWVGGTDTDWDTAGNWSNGVPSLTEKDSVYIGRNATTDLLLNIDNRTEDTNAGTDFTVFEIEEGCTINVGASGSPAYFTADNLFINGGGSVYITCETGSSGTANVDNLVMDAPQTTAFLRFTDGPDTSDFLAGLITVEAIGLDVYAVRMAGSILSPGATPHVTLRVGADSTIKPVYANAGTLIVDATGLNSVSAPLLANLVNNGAEIQAKNTSDILQYLQLRGTFTVTSSQQSVAITNAVIMGGILDIRSFQSAFGAAIVNLTLFNDATWLRTAAQEAATTVDIIGE